MERLLKVQTHNAVGPFQNYLEQQKNEVHPDRSDVFKADLLEQIEKRDLVKVDYEQLYWEAMPEGSRVSLNQLFRVSLLTLYLAGTYSSPFPTRSPKDCYFQEEKKRRKSKCQIHASYTRHRVYQDSYLQSYDAHKRVPSNYSIRECWFGIHECA